MAGAFGAGLLAGEVGLQGKVEAVLREDAAATNERARAHGHLYRVTDEEVKAGGAFLSMVLAKSPEKVTERGRAVAMEWRRREGERKIEQLYREADALGVSAAGTLGAGTVRTTAAARAELEEMLGEQEIKEEAVATAEDFAIRASRDEGLDF